MFSVLQVSMVFFFFSDPSRARKIRFCDDIWLLSNSLLASFVSVSLVLGLPDRLFDGRCCCRGDILAVRFRLFFLSVSCSIITVMSLPFVVGSGEGDGGGGGGGGGGGADEGQRSA